VSSCFFWAYELCDDKTYIAHSGNAAIIASTVFVILSLTWGGVKYPWSSYHVLVPLVLGLAGIASFMLYEFSIAPHPIVPRHLLGNRTSLSGCVLAIFYSLSMFCAHEFSSHSYTVTFIHGIIVTLVVFYLPTYFQGSQGASAIRSGVLLFATALIIGTLSFLPVVIDVRIYVDFPPPSSSICHYYRAKHRAHGALSDSELRRLGPSADWLRRPFSTNCYVVHRHGRRVANHRRHGIRRALRRSKDLHPRTAPSRR